MTSVDLQFLSLGSAVAPNRQRLATIRGEALPLVQAPRCYMSTDPRSSETKTRSKPLEIYQQERRAAVAVDKGMDAHEIGMKVFRCGKWRVTAFLRWLFPAQFPPSHHADQPHHHTPSNELQR